MSLLERAKITQHLVDKKVDKHVRNEKEVDLDRRKLVARNFGRFYNHYFFYLSKVSTIVILFIKYRININKENEKNIRDWEEMDYATILSFAECEELKTSIQMAINFDENKIPNQQSSIEDLCKAVQIVEQKLSQTKRRRTIQRKKTTPSKKKKLPQNVIEIQESSNTSTSTKNAGESESLPIENKDQNKTQESVLKSGSTPIHVCYSCHIIHKFKSQGKRKKQYNRKQGPKQNTRISFKKRIHSNTRMLFLPYYSQFQSSKKKARQSKFLF